MKKIHRPALVNAREMARAYPESFAYPCESELSHIGKNDFAKICDQQDRFWVEVVSRKDNVFRGRIDSYVMSPNFSYGDLIEFHSDNIYEILHGV